MINRQQGYQHAAGHAAGNCTSIATTPSDTLHGSNFSKSSRPIYISGVARLATAAVRGEPVGLDAEIKQTRCADQYGNENTHVLGPRICLAFSVFNSES